MGSKSSSEKEILQKHQEVVEEEETPEQYVAPRSKLPIGIGPYAVLGKPRPKQVKKKKKKKPEPKTLEELLMTDSEEEEEEEEEIVQNIVTSRKDTAQTPTLASARTVKIQMKGKSRMSSRAQTELSIDDDDDSDIEFGSQFLEMNEPDDEGPGVLFDDPAKIITAREIAGMTNYKIGKCPVSFSPIPSEADLHTAVIDSETRHDVESRPDFAYQFAYDNYGEDDDRQSLVTDTSVEEVEEEEDLSWMEEGRTNKQLG